MFIKTIFDSFCRFLSKIIGSIGFSWRLSRTLQNWKILPAVKTLIFRWKWNIKIFSYLKWIPYLHVSAGNLIELFFECSGISKVTMFYYHMTDCSFVMTHTVSDIPYDSYARNQCVRYTILFFLLTLIRTNWICELALSWLLLKIFDICFFQIAKRDLNWK